MKRYFLAVFSFIGFIPFNYAQVLPVLKSKPKPVVVKKSKVQPLENKAQRSDSLLKVQSYKIICDAPGDLFIDGEKKSRMEPDVPYRIKLPQGEYILKVIGADNPNDQIREKLFVKDIGPERLYEIGLKAIVEERLQKEERERLEEQRKRSLKQEQERKEQLAEQAVKKQTPPKNEWKTKYDEYVKNIKTVKIGSQSWMQENLNVDRFRNGELIPEVKSAKEWAEAGKNQQPAWCYYHFDSTNGVKYGRLYNWYALTDSRGLAPEGWHLPKIDDWIGLINETGTEYKAGNQLKSATGWNSYKGKREGNGQNTSGFTALPSGMIDMDGMFLQLGESAIFWGIFGKSHTLIHLESKDDRVAIGGGSAKDGYPVRCLKK